MKRFVKFCAVALVLVSLATTAYAAGTVSYDAGAHKYIFAPGSKESPTNLFGEFRDVLPGDTLTESIVIKNATSNKVKIRVYLRSLGAQEDTEDFLSQLKLTVKQKNDSVLFSAPADEVSTLKDWVYLGTVYSGGEIPLEVTLEVPLTLGNEYQDQVGYIDWQFKIDELAIDPTDPQPPKTGDTSPIALYVALMAASFTAVVILLLLKRRKKDN